MFTLWQNILGYDNIQKDDNFFDLGGHSLLMGRLQIKINEVFDKDISLIDLYEYPTIKSLAKYISNQQEIIHKPELTRVENKIYRENRETDIAIIGMAGRYPKANNIKKFWNNLLEGVEAISFFTDEELEYLPKGNLNSELKFIKARGILENVDKFDAEFFGYNPREAAIMDPQHRIFLECAWEALEDAGYNSENYEGSIGVFAGAALSTYMMFNVFSDRRKLEEVISSYQIAEYVTITGSDNSFLPTKVAYKLGLRGPAINIQSACSTSLVAIGQAYQNLLSGECDMALAGGVSITFPQKRGYFYVDGSIGSIDGHCKPFDADATGTIFSSAAGIIVLKRLQDAIKDGDSIYAVIKSVALNNDGSNKAGYMTPSVDGQAAVIRRAQQIAGINPSTIRYIETHGTGTPVGDPIEIKGLEKAFRESTNETQFCGIGSVKSNVGHTDIAAGVTGIIKTALSLKNRVIPPTLHYKNPNPKIDFKNSPFFVVDKLTNLGNTPYPIHAAVSAFGVGGTNAHAILEEFSESCPEFEKSIGKQILVVSAKTETALKNNLDALMVYLNNNPNESITNVAFTLQEGRKEFAWRQFVVADNNTKASEEIAKAVSSEINKGKFNSNDNPHLVFMFPGQGAQYVNMGKGLYESEELFREMVDHCAEFLKPHLKLDIRDLLFPENINEATAEKLEQTVYTQPALFIIEYALAQLLLSYGIRPGSMIGHSIGDYVAACLAGVFSVEDALYIIAMRARLMQKQQPGSMLSVRLNESDIKQYLNEDICLAAINSPLLTVLSGPTDRVKDLSEKLTELKIENRVLYTSHAYHSRMMEPALQPFTDEFSKITLNKPTAPLISSLTGTWITDEQATDPNFWASQLRNPVRFSSGITELQKKNNLIFIELGPGRALSTMVSQHRVDGIKQSVFTTLTKPNEDIDDQKNFYSSIGKLWVAGLKIDWKNFHKNKKRRRIHLPTYQFDRKSYWIEPPKANITELEKLDTVQTRQSIKRVVKKPSIKKVIQETSMTRKEKIILLLKDVLEELSGINKAQLDETKTFVEQGFDSLFMTQVTLGFQKKFDVKITLRQLLETNPNLLSIADYIDSKLPEGKFEPVKQEVIVEEESEEDVEEFDEATAYFEEEQQNNYNQSKNNVVEKLVFEQLEIMKKQLKLLGGKEIKTPVIQTQLAKKEKGDNVPLISSSIGSEIITPPKEEKKVFERFGPYKPIETKKGSALTSQQQKYLDKLIRDYNKKTKNSKKLTQQHRAHYADPRTVSGFLPIWKEMTYQVVTERSEGARLWDIDGNEYIDVLMGFGQYLFGHNPKFIRDVILEQIPKGFEIGPQSPIAGEVAKLICELTGMERAGFCVTGSEAVLGAIRAARTVSGKDKIVFFTGDYHGIIDEVLVKTNVIGNTLKTMPIAPGIPRENVQNSIVLEYGTEESLKAIEKLLPEIAAVMVEPVQSRRLDFQPKDFLQKLRKMTEEAKVALIFDEVITGFRSCQGGAQEWFGVRADISTYGKVIGGGFPIGIIAGKSLYMDAFDGGMWQYGDESIPEAGVTFFAGTFVRHPLSLTGALASLKYLKSKNGTLQASLNKKTAELTEELNAFFTQINMPLKMINFSSIFYYAYPKDLSYFNLLFYVLRNKGLHILEGFPIFLSEAHNDKDIKFIIEVFKESVVELQDNGFFPAPLTIDEKKKINVPIGQALEENKYPLTDAQMEIWVASLLNENASCAFNESSHLVFKGNLSKDAMEKAFNKLIERHEALRTTFSSDGQYQLVHNNSNFKLIFTDISKFNDDEKKKITSDKINSETSKAFDLINGPLLRAELIKLEEEDHRLTITAHHIICDGWSYDVMVKDLSRIYSEEVEQNFVEIKTPMQMREFGSFSEEIKKTSEYKEQEKYWLNKLASPRNESELPTDYPRPKVRTFNGSRVTVQINSALFKNTKDLSAKSGNTLFVTLLSAFSLLLYKLTQDEDVITGIPVAGQQIVGAHDLVGHCTNLLPIRFNVEPDLKFSNYLKLVKSLVLDAYDNQQVTYGDIISKLKIKRNAGKPPLLSTMFNVDPSIMGLNFSGVECDFLPSQIAGYQFEFGFNLVNYSNTYSIECEYNPDLFSSKTAEKFIHYYNYILEQIVEDIDKPLKGFQIISSSEIMNILNNFNDKKS
ncbi:MAG: aminotransferase class III-fold pyridoxal phosphate-dependent enzyme [Ignavibacteriota bacterium]